MLKNRPLLLAALAASCSGCASFSPSDLATPSKLTVSDAMLDIGTGFANLKKGITQDDSDFRTGLYPCKVTVTLNVTASAEAGGGLVIDTNLKPPPTVADAGATVQLNQTNTSSAQNTNNIAIELYNPACIPAGTVGYNTPEKVDALTTSMKSGISSAVVKGSQPGALSDSGFGSLPVLSPPDLFPSLEGVLRELEQQREEPRPASSQE